MLKRIKCISMYKDRKKPCTKEEKATHAELGFRGLGTVSLSNGTSS